MWEFTEPIIVEQLGTFYSTLYELLESLLLTELGYILSRRH